MALLCKLIQKFKRVFSNLHRPNTNLGPICKIESKKKEQSWFKMSTSGEHINQPTRKRPLIETDKPTTILCTVVAIDYRNLLYRVCSVCERTLPENSDTCCRHCNFTSSFMPATSGSKRLFRVLVSICVPHAPIWLKFEC